MLGTQRLGRGRLHAIARGFAVSPAAQVSSGRKRPGCSGSPGDESGGRPNPWRRLAALTQAPARWGGEAGKKAKVPAMQDSRVRSLGQEDPPGEGMATHSSILTWRIPWTEEPGGIQSMGSQSQTRLSDYTHTRLRSALQMHPCAHTPDQLQKSTG